MSPSARPPENAHAYRCERATAAHADGLLALFESAENGCYCNYWYFEGDKNAWLERCYLKPEENRAALVARLTRPELCGVVALARPQQAEQPGQPDGALCGWLNLSRATSVPRLYDQRVYRNLPCFEASVATNPAREDVFAVACCFVAEADRGRGVARALLDAAIVAVREAGGSALEAFPRATPAAEQLRPDEIWLGPEALFAGAGFTPVSDFRPYPVLRLHLR
jgi:ribosomal protein S18 acetylase RimI-like enzyme